MPSAPPQPVTPYGVFLLLWRWQSCAGRFPPRRPGLGADDGRVVEADTCQCSHCGQHFHVKPKQRAEDCGGFCYVCSKPVCARCVGKGCDELERKLEREEASYHARRSYGL
jgi:hypothetical protein